MMIPVEAHDELELQLTPEPGARRRPPVRTSAPLPGIIVHTPLCTSSTAVRCHRAFQSYSAGKKLSAGCAQNPPTLLIAVGYLAFFLWLTSLYTRVGVLCDLSLSTAAQKGVPSKIFLRCSFVSFFWLKQEKGKVNF